MSDNDRRPPKRSKPPSDLRRRPLETKSLEPEIRIAVGPAGRETLEAIADELATSKKASRRRSLGTESSPEIVVRQVPVGRETLAAIEEELRGKPREALSTLPYGDRVPNAPGAVTPSKPPTHKRAPSRRPERTSSKPSSEPEIFEILSFLVHHSENLALRSEEAKRSFVSARLRHRLPGGDLSSVSRIDVTPSNEQNMAIVRVFCRVSAPASHS